MYPSTNVDLISLIQSTCHHETLQLKGIGKTILFASVPNSFLHLSGFEARHLPSFLNNKEYAYVDNFHTKHDKTF